MRKVVERLDRADGGHLRGGGGGAPGNGGRPKQLLLLFLDLGDEGGGRRVLVKEGHDLLDDAGAEPDDEEVDDVLEDDRAEALEETAGALLGADAEEAVEEALVAGQDGDDLSPAVQVVDDGPTSLQKQNAGFGLLNVDLLLT